MPSLLDEAMVGVTDIARSTVFYDAVLGALGLERLRASERYVGYVAKGNPAGHPQFWICLPFNQKPATSGNGTQIGFRAADRAAVDRFHAAAMAHGGADEGKPGLRPHYHANFYGAYVRDPDGNKLLAVCHDPA
ncbi:MAG: VOC family protein [Alphaproteobacteria bacterium]